MDGLPKTVQIGTSVQDVYVRRLFPALLLLSYRGSLPLHPRPRWMMNPRCNNRLLVRQLSQESGLIYEAR